MTEGNQTCEGVVDRLLAFLRGGAELSAANRAHPATRSECARALAAARSLQDELGRDETPGNANGERVERVTLQAQAALRTMRWRRAAMTLLASLGVLCAWLLVPTGVLAWPEKVVVFLAAALLTAMIVGCFSIVRRVVSGAHGRKLYRRLSRGRWLAGVCSGLSESSGVSVWLIRAVFVGPLFLGRIGIPLHLILTLALEVHPEDRGLLLRFKLRHWLARLTRREAAGRSGEGFSPCAGLAVLLWQGMKRPGAAGQAAKTGTEGH